MIISCVKWGDKFSHEHVNRLYRMVRKNIDVPFSFLCHTDNPTGLYSAIEVKHLDENLELEDWWWKLTLFDENGHLKNKHKKYLFFDLDVVIQGNLQPFIDAIQEDKVTIVKAHWKNYPLEDRDMNNNSSVMAWTGDVSYLWRKFNKDPENYLLKYNGIDGFMTHECPDKIGFFKRGLVYSRLFGVDEKECFAPINGNEPTEYFYKPDYPLCIFNGWRREQYADGSYWLDDNAYDGMKKYWSTLQEANYSGIERQIWKALWECSYSGGDVKHFLDSMSDNQLASKRWLVETLATITTKNDAIQPIGDLYDRIQLWGGWFAHPITTLLNNVFDLELIENIDMDESALHYCRIINEGVTNLDTTCADVTRPGPRDWDTDLVINTSSEHMPPLSEILKNKNYRTSEDNSSRGPTIFALQSNNMFHVEDHINCVKSEDELAKNTGLPYILYKGSINMPNGYKRFMVIGHA